MVRRCESLVTAFVAVGLRARDVRVLRVQVSQRRFHLVIVVSERPGLHRRGQRELDRLR